MSRRILWTIATYIALVPIGLPGQIGKETSGYVHLENGEELQLSLGALLERGRHAFTTMWTVSEGGGRPHTNGVGGMVADPGSPLSFPRNFNRISAMDANGCAGCHNLPFSGGGGDFVTGVFVAGQRFDSVTFDHGDGIPLRGAVNEAGAFVTLPDVANYRATLGMFGSGYIEMLARQMTSDLQAARGSLAASGSVGLMTKGVSFGTLARAADGSWDVSGLEGLPLQSVESGNADDPPSLIVHPFHQSGSVVSLRQFTNNAFNHHHGIQAAERFGSGLDPDGDGHYDELTRADVTAVSVFQATLPVPGQVVPNNLAVEEAIFKGERLFSAVGCGSCHKPSLPLTDQGWVYTEPSPYNPNGNLQPGDGGEYSVDLSSDDLPGYRLKPNANGVVWVPAFTDLKLHDITTGAPDDPNREALNINAPGGSDTFLSGNSRFLTKKLWGAANEPPYFHHGKFTTLREATLAHYGQAQWTRDAFLALTEGQQNQVIEFLKSLQALPPGTKAAVVDENGEPKIGWPPKSFFSWRFVAGAR